MLHRALLAMLAIASCKSGDHVPDVAAPELQIVNAGTEPRHLLRYHATKATTQSSEVAIDMDVAAGTVVSPLPTLVFTLSIGVDEIQSDGRIKLRTTVSDVVARDRAESKVARAGLSDALQPMKGVVLTALLSPSGRLSQTTIETRGLPDAIKEQLASLTTGFEQLTMVFPEEPVGVGAVWRSGKPVEQSGMKLKAVNTITVTAIDGDKLAFAIETQVHGDDQIVTQGGSSVDVKDITGTGSGKGSIDLATLAMTSEVAAELRSEMTSPGEPEPTPMRMKLTTTVKPR